MTHLLLAAFLSTQAADTAYTLHLRNHGFREANRLLSNRTAGIVLAKSAITTTGAVAAWKWRKTHPKVAAAILVIGTASATAATVHNARLASRLAR